MVKESMIKWLQSRFNSWGEVRNFFVGVRSINGWFTYWEGEEVSDFSFCSEDPRGDNTGEHIFNNDFTGAKKVFGFAVELHKTYLVFPAHKEDNIIRCHDLSGFGGSWDMEEGGVFFPQESEDILCAIALDKATKFALSKNKELTRRN